MRVYKYELVGSGSYGSEKTLSLPIGAHVMHVDLQYRAIQLWALVDETQEKTEERTILIAGTGHDIPVPADRLVPINSFLVNDGQAVFHAFEKRAAI